MQAPQDDIAVYRDRYRDGLGRAAARALGADDGKLGIVDCRLSRLAPDIVPDWNLTGASSFSGGSARARWAVPSPGTA